MPRPPSSQTLANQRRILSVNLKSANIAIKPINHFRGNPRRSTRSVWNHGPSRKSKLGVSNPIPRYAAQSKQHRNDIVGAFYFKCCGDTPLQHIKRGEDFYLSALRTYLKPSRRVR